MQYFALYFAVLLCILSIHSSSVHASHQFYNISVAQWNKEYSKGDWKYLDAVAIERARASLIAVFYQTYSQNGGGTILDVGCGEGVLSDYLTDKQKKDYTGVDISEVAVNVAKEKRKIPSFYASPAHSYMPDHRFDTIVFNEMLYYVNHKHIMKRFARFLNPDGIIIISIWYSDKVTNLMTKIFQDAGALFNQIDDSRLSGSTTIKNQKLPVTFRVGVFKLSHNPIDEPDEK
jgi:2-polyprenyl-3-methyl-5-hydroxy-6-metoxy-1,4-benzoquinol methylase